MPNHDQQYLTDKEAARVCGVSRRTIERWRHDGRIAVVLTPGGRPRVRAEDLTVRADDERGARRR